MAAEVDEALAALAQEGFTGTPAPDPQVVVAKQKIVISELENVIEKYKVLVAAITAKADAKDGLVNALELRVAELEAEG